MKLNFLGRGAAFNPKEGNTSAFFIENKTLFLIDCGENVFEKIITNNIINSINTINLMITHTHSDHIGSLGSLVMYSFYILNKPLNIILPENAKYLSNIEKILSGFGCTNKMYNYIDEKTFDNKLNTFNKLRFIETKHCNELNSYGIKFNTKNGILYYSGDTCEIKIIKEIINSKQPIDKLYIDTTTVNTTNNVHLYIGILKNEIPNELKKYVYCMHLNNDHCIEEAIKLGFNVVESIDNKRND